MNISLNGLPITNISYNNAVQKIINCNKPNTVVYTPNVQHYYLYKNDSNFKKAYDNCHISLADGMGIVWGVKFFNGKTIEKISGSDIFVDVFQKTLIREKRIFLLGAAPGIAEKAAQILSKGKTTENLVETYSPSMNFINNHEEMHTLTQKINSFKPHILFVALGTPKQENWIYEYRNKINVNILIGVGASFDFVAGVQKRAPVFLQNIGLEWLFRLILNPKHLLTRYAVTNTFFLFSIIRHIVKSKFIHTKK